MTKYYLAFDPSAIVDMRIDDAAMVSDDKKYFYSFFEEEKESSHFVFVEFDIDLQSRTFVVGPMIEKKGVSNAKR